MVNKFRQTNGRVWLALFVTLTMLTANASAQDSQIDLTGSVTDESGGPIADAKVLLVYKSWPNNRYRQQVFDTKTGSDGKFRFEQLYSTDMQTAFLVSIVADGWAINSRYVVNESRERLEPFDMQMDKAISKTFVFRDSKGPRSGVKVYPSSRRAGDQEHLIYGQSAGHVMQTTDGDGKIQMNLFADGDIVKFGVADGGDVSEVKVKIDKSAEQTIGGETGKQSIAGALADPDGNPVAGARVLLIQKSWPNNRFRMENFTTKSDDNGEFSFGKRYKVGDRTEFLVSVVADGWQMASEYVSNPEGQKLPPFDFQLREAVKKTFVIRDAAGKPMRQAMVWPSSRRTADGDEHMIYAVSARFVDAKTDSKGQIKLNFFGPGDTATLGVKQGGSQSSIEVEVDKKSRQSVAVKKKMNRRR